VKYFLEQVADQLYESYGDSLGRHTIVFPGRRAGVFLMKHLSAIAGKPLWAPRTITINELFAACSRLTVAPAEQLVFELYRIYRQLSGSSETFDNFYFWGEMLLGDFDDIDKNLVDARALFTNISDLHRIDEQFGGLTPEQVEIIREFIVNFRSGSVSDQKRDFEFTWSLLWPLYSKFMEALESKSLAYEGMVLRKVVTELSDNPHNALAAGSHFHFVGFNALNGGEQKLMKYLAAEGMASFYWDYSDSGFFRDDSASGLFIRNNIKQFGQNLKAITDIPVSTGREKPGCRITITDVPSDTGQTKLLPLLLSEVLEGVAEEDLHRTALVLADEKLLPSVITSIPPTVADINITMGYPFSMTTVYSFLKSLLDLQDRPVNIDNCWYFDQRKVLPVVTNPLVNRIAGTEASAILSGLYAKNMQLVPAQLFESMTFLGRLFVVAENASGVCAWLREVLVAAARALDSLRLVQGGEQPADRLTHEFLFRAGHVLNSLEPLLADTSVPVSREIFMRLADRVFRGIKVPFRGEPLKGLQVMGLLESRALGFDNIIILSANEGVLPGATYRSSYIPNSLREAFGLPTTAHNDSVYSYYFARLLSRARNISLVYNSSSEGIRTGEMSRYLLRLKYSGTFSPVFRSASLRISRRPSVPDERVRTATDNESLHRLYLRGTGVSAVSPSALNTWLNCTMKFYYSYVCGLRETERLTTGIDPARFGSILHELVARIYEPFRNQIVTSDILQQLKRSYKSGNPVIREVIEKQWYGGTRAPASGTTLVTADIAAMFLGRVLDIDARLAPFTIIDLEERFSSDVEVLIDGRKETVAIGGTIDRIDEREGVRRLIDYKTGKAELSVDSLNSLFDRNSKTTNDAVVQTLLYCQIMSEKDGYHHLRPVIYGLRTAGADDFDDHIYIDESRVDDFKPLSGQFKILVKDTLSDIFNPQIPFTKTTHNARCNYCPYRNLCQR